MSLREAKIDFWANRHKNILLIGPSGVGKTQMFREGMERAGLSFDTNVAQWSTPLLDFVGTDVHAAAAIYFDALQNDLVAQAAVREVISLRRWRGKAVKESAIVWAAYTEDKANKDEESLLVTSLAFDATIRVPSKPDPEYFEKKFGKALSDVIIKWWLEIPLDEQEVVSPRRLEQTLKMWQDKGDIRDVMYFGTNSRKLLIALKEVTP